MKDRTYQVDGVVEVRADLHLDGEFKGCTPKDAISRAVEKALENLVLIEGYSEVCVDAVAEEVEA